jgi:hypothetical protein
LCSAENAMLHCGNKWRFVLVTSRMKMAGRAIRISDSP